MKQKNKLTARSMAVIAMLAAVASAVCTGSVTLRDAGAVKKSYPRFWADYRKMTKEDEP